MSKHGKPKSQPLIQTSHEKSLTAARAGIRQWVGFKSHMLDPIYHMSTHHYDHLQSMEKMDLPIAIESQCVCGTRTSNYTPPERFLRTVLDLGSYYSEAPEYCMNVVQNGSTCPISRSLTGAKTAEMPVGGHDTLRTFVDASHSWSGCGIRQDGTSMISAIPVVGY